jgi:hypothetical protein
MHFTGTLTLTLTLPETLNPKPIKGLIFLVKMPKTFSSNFVLTLIQTCANFPIQKEKEKKKLNLKIKFKNKNKNRFAEWLSEEHKARQFHAIESSSSSSSVSKTKVFKPMLPNPSSLPSKLDPEVGGEEKIMTSVEDLEKSKDKANGGGGGHVRPSIFEHGHDEQSSSFVSSPYIPSSAWSFFDNPFELPQPDISFTNPPRSSSDPPKHSADSPGYVDPPKYLVDSPGYYFDPPKCSIGSPGYPDSPHPLSYYYYIGFPEPLHASSLHPYNENMHPGTEASSYKRNYCESSDRLLSLLPTPITPKVYSYGNSRFPQEHEDYPQSQFSNSASTKIDDYFQLFS